MSYQEYRPSSFQILPPIIKNILIINGLVYISAIFIRNKFDVDLADYLGLHYFFSQKFSPFQLIGYMFMHAYRDENTGRLIWEHIVFNMFALWMFGSALENLWGPKRFLTFYLITGLGAALAHYTIFYFQIHPTLEAVNAYINNPDAEQFEAFFQSRHLKIASVEIQDLVRNITTKYNSLEATGDKTGMLNCSVDFMKQYKVDLLNAPVVIGASGSVAGILAAFGMLFPNTMLYIYFAIPVKAKYAVIGYAAYELYMGVSNSEADNVAHFAHIGGMLFGFITLKLWNMNKTNFF